MAACAEGRDQPLEVVTASSGPCRAPPDPAVGAESLQEGGPGGGEAQALQPPMCVARGAHDRCFGGSEDTRGSWRGLHELSAERSRKAVSLEQGPPEARGKAGWGRPSSPRVVELTPPLHTGALAATPAPGLLLPALRGSRPK